MYQAVTRGSLWCIYQSRKAATAATRIPAMTWSGVTVALDEKYSTHGDTATQTPAARVSHAGHSANTASAATASAAIRMPPNQAFQFMGLSAENPNAQGEKNS